MVSLHDAEVVKYINRIRNQNKKQYAMDYYNYISGQTNIKPVYHGQSLMAQQSIEHECHRLLES